MMGKSFSKLRWLGLERFGLNDSSFRRLASRKVQAFVHLRTYDVTTDVRKLPPAKRLPYLSTRVDRWISKLRLSFPHLEFEVVGGISGRHRPLPGTLKVHCTSTELFDIAGAGIRSIYVARIAGLRPHKEPTSKVEWFCVRALVVIRVEGASSGLQSVEDRFVLVRATSFENATKRLRKQWVEYSAPYLNSEGRIVSWQFDHAVDVYQLSESEINPAGTEVYSKLRKMRPAAVWRPRPGVPLFKPKW